MSSALPGSHIGFSRSSAHWHHRSAIARHLRRTIYRRNQVIDTTMYIGKYIQSNNRKRLATHE